MDSLLGVKRLATPLSPKHCPVFIKTYYKHYAERGISTPHTFLNNNSFLTHLLAANPANECTFPESFLHQSGSSVINTTVSDSSSHVLTSLPLPLLAYPTESPLGVLYLTATSTISSSSPIQLSSNPTHISNKHSIVANTECLLPAKIFCNLGLSHRSPMTCTIVPHAAIQAAQSHPSHLAICISSFTITVLACGVPHASSYCVLSQIDAKQQQKKIANQRQLALNTNIESTERHELNSNVRAELAHSNTIALSNAVLTPPPQCTCTTLPTLHEIVSSELHLPKCLYCLLTSPSESDLSYIADKLLPFYLQQHPKQQSNLQQHSTHITHPPHITLCSPIPQYSIATRISLQLFLFPSPTTSTTTTTSHINLQTNLEALLTDPQAVKMVLWATPLQTGSWVFLSHGLQQTTSQSSPALAIYVQQTYPTGVVVPQQHTVVQLAPYSFNTLSPPPTSATAASIPSSLSHTQQPNQLSSLLTLRQTTPCLFPSDIAQLAQQPIAVQAIFRSLFLNLSKSYYSRCLALASSSQTTSIHQSLSNAFANLSQCHLGGLLLHGQPGVGKTFATLQSLRLFSQMMYRNAHIPSLSSSLSSSSSPLSLLHLPLISSPTVIPGATTIAFPVIRFCSIDSSSIGEYITGTTEQRISSVFDLAMARHITAHIPSTTTQPTTTSTYSTATPTYYPESFWSRGFLVDSTYSSYSMGSDRVFPLFAPNSPHFLALLAHNGFDLNASSSEHATITPAMNISCYVALTLILIDEINALCPLRSLDSSRGNVNLTNHFLTLLDGLSSKATKLKSSQHPIGTYYNIVTSSHLTSSSSSSSTPSPTEQQQQHHSTSLASLPCILPYSASALPPTTTPNVLSTTSPTDLSSVQDTAPLFVVGTTNHPNDVDMAIKRSGRLDQLLSVPPPTSEQRLQLLHNLTKNVTLSTTDPMPLHELADNCIGYVAADLVALLRTAKLHALKRWAATNNFSLVGGDDDDDDHNPNAHRQPSEPIHIHNALTRDDFLYALQHVGPAALRQHVFASVQAKLRNSTTLTNHISRSIADHTLSQQQQTIRLLVGSFAHEIGGLYEAKLRLLEGVVWPWKYKVQCQQLGLSPPRGILLHGPPGNGKTSLARAVARSLQATFLPLDMAQVYNSYLGESEALLRKTFATARDNAPAVIFIDELDSIVSKRDMGDGGGHNSDSSDMHGRILATLLNEMDGIPTTTMLSSFMSSIEQPLSSQKQQQQQQTEKSNTTSAAASGCATTNTDDPLTSISSLTQSQYNDSYVLVFGATNRVDLLDGALLRPGRFDYILLIDNCNEETAYEVIAAKAQKTPIDPSIDLKQLTSRLVRVLQQSGLGANGANLSNAISEAANHAMKRIIQGKPITTSYNESNPDPNQQSADQKQQQDSWKALPRYALKDYFSRDNGDGDDDDDATIRSKICITMDDFEVYFAPLEALILAKQKQQ